MGSKFPAGENAMSADPSTPALYSVSLTSAYISANSVPGQLHRDGYSIGAVLGAEDFLQIEQMRQWLEHAPPGALPTGVLNTQRVRQPVMQLVPDSLCTADMSGEKISVEYRANNKMNAIWLDIEHTIGAGRDGEYGLLTGALTFFVDEVQAFSTLADSNRPQGAPQSFCNAMERAMAQGFVGFDTENPESLVTLDELTGQLRTQAEGAGLREELPSIDGYFWGTRQQAWDLVEYMAAMAAEAISEPEQWNAAAKDWATQATHKITGLLVAHAVNGESVRGAAPAESGAAETLEEPGLGL